MLRASELPQLRIKRLLHNADGIALGGFGDVDIRLHRLVITVAGELHHNVRSDAIGQGEADEGLAAGVGANEFVLGIDIIVAGAVLVASDGIGRVEAAYLAQILQAAVHVLVGHERQRPALGEVLVLVFFQNGEGVFVEDDGQAVVGLLGGDNHHAVLDVGATDFHDIGVPEGRKGAEAEEVAGTGHAGALRDGLLILLAVIGFEFEDGAGCGNLQFVELVQLLFGEEDDGLFHGLEYRLVGFHVTDLGVAFADSPAEEPGEILVLLLDRVLLQAAVGAKVGDEFVQAVLVIEVQSCGFLEFYQVIFEGLDHFQGLHAPFLEAAFLADELLHVFNGGLGLGLLFLGFGLGDFLLDHIGAVLVADGGNTGGVLVEGLFKLFGQRIGRGLVIQLQVIVGEVGADVGDAGVDDAVVLALDVDAAFLYLLLFRVPLVLADCVANEALEADTSDTYVRAYGLFASFVDVACLEVESDFHMLPSV